MAQDLEVLGLLPHEQFFVADSHTIQEARTQQAGESIGKALDNKPSGDWGGDDTGIQAAQDDHHLQKTLLHQLSVLNGLDTLPYPDPASPHITYGSLFEITYGENDTEQYALGTRPFIQGMPEIEGIHTTSPESPMGKAVIGKVAGDAVVWIVANNGLQLSGTITHIDQTAVQEHYEEIIEQILSSQNDKA